MKKALLLAALALQVTSMTQLSAGINPGSADAGLKISGTGDLSLTNDTAMTDGTFEVTSSQSLSGNILGTRTNIVVRDGTNNYDFKFSGTYNTATGGVTLGAAGDFLYINNGDLKNAVSVNEDATIEGPGGLGGTVGVANTKTLTLGLQGTITQDINTNTTGVVTLANDAIFAEGSEITGAGTVNANNHRLVYGDGSTWTAGIEYNDLTLELTGDITMPGSGTITIGSGNNNIIGNGSAIVGNGAAIAMGTNDMTWSDLRINDFASGFLTTIGTLYLRDIVFNDADAAKNEILVHNGRITGDNPNIFGGAVTWGTSSISLLSNCHLGGAWTLGTGSLVNGNGMLLDLEGGSLNPGSQLHLRDITLSNMVAASLVSPTDIFMNNVTIFSDATSSAYGAIRISGGQRVAATELDSAQVSPTNGDFFGDSVTFDTNATVELLADVTLDASTVWTFSKGGHIIGNGHRINLSASGASIAAGSGETLWLHDVTIDGWGGNTSDAQLNFNTGTIHFNNVTVLLDGDVELAATDTFVVDGPMTIVNGSHAFTATASTNAINGVTLWYDPLGTSGAVSIDVDSGGGRVVEVVDTRGAAALTSETLSSTTEYVTEDRFWNYETTNAAGLQVDIDSSSNTVAIEGGGRRWYLGRNPGTYVSDGEPVYTSGTNAVDINDLRVEGFDPAHFGGNSVEYLQFNDGCYLRLQEDVTLTETVYTCGTTADSVVLDLGGHDLDMDNDSAAIVLGSASVDSSGSTLTIRNGRLLNVGNASDGTAKLSLLSSGTAGTLILEDVGVVLKENTQTDPELTLGAGALTIKGNTYFDTVKRQGKLIYSTTGTLTVAAGANLKFMNNVTYEHTGAPGNVTLSDTNSTIELEGATLTASGPGSGLTLTAGTLRADHTSKLSGAMTLGGTGASELHIDLMPATKLDAISGTITIAND
jgi:hypothetical protein